MKNFRITLFFSILTTIMFVIVGSYLISNSIDINEVYGGLFLIGMGAMTSIVIIDVVVTDLFRRPKMRG